MSDINDTIREREETHGAFYDNARVSQALKSTCWNIEPGLGFVQTEALEMILHKIARIVNGDPNHADHWHDIAGYATLVEQHINKEAQEHGNGNEAEKKSY